MNKKHRLNKPTFRLASDEETGPGLLSTRESDTMTFELNPMLIRYFTVKR